MGSDGHAHAHLDELMHRILGDLIYETSVDKLADDLYIGGNSVLELKYNWQRTLDIFERNNLRLKPSKTVVAPLTFSAGTAIRVPFLPPSTSLIP